MKILLVGAGGVGESIALIAKDQAWVQQMVLADYNPQRLEEVQARIVDKQRFPIERVDASAPAQIVELAKKYKVDFIMNACDPSFVETIFEAAFSYGCTYMDMAMSLAIHHPQDPYHKAHIKLGDHQFEQADKWEKHKRLAVLGMGVDPGVSDVFARYAQDELFDEIEEIGIRDGSNIEVSGYEFAPGFSIWTTIDECLNPPVVWEEGKGWYTTEPFSEPEVFNFPDGVGPVECVNVEHEEVMLVPRAIRCKKVTFKYGLGDKFINILKVLKMLGLDNKHEIEVKGVKVAPRDVVCALLPDPAHLGEKMSGKTCVGTWVKGIKNGKPRQVYLYQSTDNQKIMARLGVQAVVGQTAFGAVIGMDLIQSGVWSGVGVLGPEVFPPKPFLEKMTAYDYPYGMLEL